MSSGTVSIVKNQLECLLRKQLTSQFFKTGDGLVREVGKQLRSHVKLETVEESREGCRGFRTNCLGWDELTTAWHGSKSGAENLAGWKLMKIVCMKFLVDRNLYKQLVKRFTCSLVDVGTSCRMCKQEIELENLWDHVEGCMEARCLANWYERQAREMMECPICGTIMSIAEFTVNVEGCKWKVCETCGARIKKLEERAHARICEPPVVH